MATRILLTDTTRWPNSARLAIVLADAGAQVSAACSRRRHPLHKVRTVQTRPYNPFRPLDSLLAAIQATAPEMVIPCDDRAVQHLHELHARMCELGEAGNMVRELIERSIGDPDSYSTVSARYDILKLASDEGIRVPETHVVNSHDDLKAWQTGHPLPWVLKADGTSAGFGVRIAYTRESAERFFSELNRPFRALQFFERAIVNRDRFCLGLWWKGSRPAVVLQAYVRGRPANCAVFCWEGRVLAGISVEVIKAKGQTGPATVVRVVEGTEMMRAAERIVRRLRLSGFFGLDFVIEDVTDTSYLIEMNARCTPLCHLQLGPGRDMIEALLAQLSGQPLRDTPPVTQNPIIAYFPQTGSDKTEIPESSFQDVPFGEPGLIQEILRPWPQRSLLYRLFHFVRNMKKGVELNASATRSKASKAPSELGGQLE